MRPGVTRRFRPRPVPLVALPVVALAVWPLLAGGFWLQLATVLTLYALAAAGLDLTFGRAGLLSVGHAAFFGIGAYTVALADRETGIPGLVLLVGAVATSVLAGLLVGAVSLRVESFYFVLLTLASAIIFESIVRGVGVTGGPSGVPGVSRNLLGTGELTRGSMFVIAVVVLLAVVAGLRSLRHSRTGRAMEAIRTQEATAAACGVDVYALRLRSFAAGAGMAGLAGGLFAQSLSYISPEFVGLQQSVEFLIMAVIGGLGTIWGVVVGAVVVRGLPEFVQALRLWQLLILGLLTLLVLVRFRQGVAGTIEAAARNRRLRRAGTAAAATAERQVEDAETAMAAVAERRPDPAPPNRTPSERTASDQTFPERTASELTPGAAGRTGRGHRDRQAAGRGDGELLRVDGLTRAFGGLTAVGGVDLVVRPGEIHALVGPNGAGKTTFVNCVTGIDRPTGGTVTFRGQDVTRLPAHRRANLGLARTFQLVGLAETLTVKENVMLGAYPWTSGGMLRGTWPARRHREERAVDAAAEEVLERLGLVAIADLMPGEIPMGQRRMTEVARCLLSRADLLLLDEPAAGLNETETRALGGRLREISAEGTALLLIEHDMSLVMEISDQVTVLNFGRRIAVGAPEEVATDPEVVTAYLGTGGTAGSMTPETPAGGPR